MLTVPEYCKWTDSNHYMQTLAMSCGPTSAANFSIALKGGGELSPGELKQIVRIAVEDEGGKTIDDCLNRAGFYGEGLGKAIDSIISKPRPVIWKYGTAEMAALISDRMRPTMLVVQFWTYEHWVVCLGTQEDGKVYFQDPGYAQEWSLTMEDVKKGNYNPDGSCVFKQNGYFYFDA